MAVEIEKAIRAIIGGCVECYASGFSDRHISEIDNPEGTINMKIHNVFIAALGSDIQYYSSLARSLDSSLGNMLEKMAIKIASLNYDVTQYVEGNISQEQTNKIATLLEEYKRHVKKPSVLDYCNLSKDDKSIIGNTISKRHESDYCIFDKETDTRYLIELKIGGDLDNKKARAEKEALLEQYVILANSLGEDSNIRIFFATAYNRYGENNEWKQGRVLQYFSTEELLIGRDFWNFICKSEKGYEIVLDEYKKNAHLIIDALDNIKKTYLPNN